MLKFLTGVLVGLVLAAAVVGGVVYLAPDGGGGTRVTKSKPAKDTTSVPAAAEQPAQQ